MSKHMAKVLGVIMAAGTAMLADFAVAGDAAVFRILSYNVRHGEGMDKRLDLLRTADVVKRANPTYAGLQEVDQMTSRVAGTNSCQLLSARCGVHATFGKAMPYRGGEYGNALLSREVPLSVKTYLLPPARKKLEPRALVMCEFPDCWVGSMHLNGERSAENSAVPLIRRAVEECAAKKPVFVTGDWNTLPDSDMLKRMKEFLTILSRTDRRTMHHTKGYCIDYVAVDTAHAKDFEVVGTDVIQELVASDHRPIYVDIKKSKQVK